MAVPPAAAAVIAAALALSALSGAFLLALLLAAVIVRVPPRGALWAMAFGCWPVYGLVFPDWPRESVAGAVTSAACLAALRWLRFRQRGQWRETAGRMDGRARPAARIDANTERIEALEAMVGDLCAGLEAAKRHRDGGKQAAADAAPLRQRHLRAVPDGDTKPLPAATA